MLGLIAFAVANGVMGTSKVAHASDVLAKIKAGQPAEFDDYIIVDYLNLESLNIDKSVHFNFTLFQDPANFKSTTFRSTAYFASSTFNSTADFRNSRFNSDANFGSSTFNSDANFGSSTFNRDANFGSSNFNSTAYFRSSTFNSEADFDRSMFNSTANFGFSMFNSTANFGPVFFKGIAYFVYSAFKGTANFESSTFNREANFKSSTFNRIANLGSSNFNSTANFESSIFNCTGYFGSSTFNSTAYFRSSYFNSDADFESSNFNSDANFSESTFEKETRFNDICFNGIAIFNSSRFVDNAFFINTIFNSTLYLTHAKYEKLYIKWDNIHKLAYDNTAYQLLIENLRNLGFNKDADNCYYQFRVDQFQHWQPEIQDSLAYSIDGMAWISYGYGKKPHYPFIWSLIFIGFFGFFWRSMGLGTREWPPVARLKNGNNNNGKLLLHALAFSLTVFLSGTKLFIDPPNIPVLQGRWASIVRPAFIIERVLGAFFSILFFLAIGETIVG